MTVNIEQLVFFSHYLVQRISTPFHDFYFSHFAQHRPAWAWLSQKSSEMAGSVANKRHPFSGQHCDNDFA